MFNPSDLKVVKDSYRPKPHAFVGIRRNEDGEVELRLPVGFDDFPAEDPVAINAQFFRLYRTLKVFAAYQRGRRSTTSEDGIRQEEGGFSFVNKDDEPVTLLSKLSMLDAVLDGYDELRIFQIVYRPQRAERIDYAQIHRYLDRAIYLDNDAAFIDEMVLPQPVLSYEISDLVRMFCFIYAEVKRALEEASSLRKAVVDQGAIFKEQHLYADAGLFTQTHERTVQLLKEELAKLHRHILYKNHDYWHFYEAIETFLYGELEEDEDGMLWGISTFSDVWEDMCLTYVFEKGATGTIYADTNRSEYTNSRIGSHSLFVAPGFDPPFWIGFNGAKRYMRPDQVQGPQDTEDWFENWFEENFEVEWRSKYEVRIRRLTEDNLANRVFDSLSKELRLPGSRPQRGRNRTFRSTPKSKFDRAKSKELDKFDSDDEGGVSFRIWDYKYMPRFLYAQSWLTTKPMQDIRKQLVYEYALQQAYPEHGTRSKLCIPRYFMGDPADGAGEDVPSKQLSRALNDAGVGVYEADYKQIERVYFNTHEADA